VDRYAAACVSALAAAGQGEDAGKLDATERARLRRQALDWLKAETAAWGKRLSSPSIQERAAVGDRLRLAQRDHALAGVRDGAALSSLPAPERSEWKELWVHVRKLLARDPLGGGREHAARRQWASAAESYSVALDLAPETNDSSVWFEIAAVRLLAGDTPGYRSACEHMVQRCGKAPQMRPGDVARACTLAPNAVKDLARVEQLAGAALKAGGSEFWALKEQAALHYRAGRHAEALPLLQQSLQTRARPAQKVVSWLWLVLTCRALEKTEEAHRWQERATRWLEQQRARVARSEDVPEWHLHNWLEAHVLAGELGK
jgi:hypothetical protein